MRRRGEIGWRLAAIAALVAGCESRPVLLGDGGRDVSTPKIDHSSLDHRRADRPRVDAPRVDVRRDLPPKLDKTSPDLGSCYCKVGEVMLLSPCVTTDKMMTCGPTCNSTSPTSCTVDETCDPYGGTPCCMCSALVPACVPKTTIKPMSGPLRITPTQGTAGLPVKLNIQGAPFYIGALFYNVRMGSEVKPEESGTGQCSIGATFTPPNPGIYVVEVSQYGGGTPWVLAGFYTASGGVIPMPTIQPGYTCATNPAPGDPACASASPYSCTCVAGRCVCK
jgi:hypothetical protein